jgi:hypothetical protein
VAAIASLGEIGTRHPDRVGRIADLMKGQKPRVRRAVAWALGWIGGEEAVKVLRRMVATEESKFNVGTALLGIARSRREDAFDLLRAELGRESHRDILRQLIFDGFAILKDPRAIPILIEHTQPSFRNEDPGSPRRDAPDRAVAGSLVPRPHRRRALAGQDQVHSRGGRPPRRAARGGDGRSPERFRRSVGRSESRPLD